MEEGFKERPNLCPNLKILNYVKCNYQIIHDINANKSMKFYTNSYELACLLTLQFTEYLEYHAKFPDLFCSIKISSLMSAASKLVNEVVGIGVCLYKNFYITKQ